MSLPSSLHAYPAEADAFDKALSSTHGIGIPQESENAAHHFQHRLNKARALHRTYNRTVFAKDHPLHGHSEWDPLSAIIRQDKDDKWWVFIIPVKQEISEYVELTGPIPDEPRPEPTPIAQLTFRRI
jgi:hypothetical protein